MKLKAKPKPPVRKEATSTESLFYNLDGELQDVIDFLTGKIDASNTSQRIEVRQWYDDVDIDLISTSPEPQEDFDKRVDAYNERVKVYDEWYAENEDDIKAELALRKDKKNYAKQKEIKKLQDKLDKLKANG